MEESEAGYDVIMEARINKSCLIATSIQLGFDKFAYLMHSLLAGISLWHVSILTVFDFFDGFIYLKKIQHSFSGSF